MIESWARPDVTADLLAGFEVVAPVAAPPPQESAVVPAPIASVVSTPTTVGGRAQPSGVTLAIMGDYAVDRRSSWVGAMATACMPLGGTCVGVTGHVRTSSNVDQPAETALLVSVDLPVHIGRLTLIPGIGIGAGRDILIADTSGMQTTAWSARAEARLIASYPLAGGVSLDVGVGVVGATSTAEDPNQIGDNVSTTGPTAWFQLGAGLSLGVSARAF